MQFSEVGKFTVFLLLPQARTFWYRKDLWDELGLTEPKTYQEMEEALCQGKAAGIYHLSAAGKYGLDGLRLLDYLLEVTAGPKLHDKLNTAEENWNRRSDRNISTVQNVEMNGLFLDSYR